MKPISLQQALLWMPQATLQAPQHLPLKRTTSYGVNTDTRTLRSNNLFVALKGDRFDGHRFLDFAQRQQAGFAVVHFDAPELAAIRHGGKPWTMPLITVSHTGEALQQLARGYRAQFRLPLVVVVGSNGKTTVKEMIHSIFKTHCAMQGNERAAHCTVGNFNNEIGLPLTLLRLNDHHRYSTVELGMNHPGETALLAAIAAPTIALINNAQREHQEHMQTVEAVAVEHAAVIASLAQGGTVVLPAQDTYAALWRSHAGAAGKTVMDFALHTASDQTLATVVGTIVGTPASTFVGKIADTSNDKCLTQTLALQTPQGACSIALAAAGEHNARNALAATTVALAAGIPLTSIAAGLAAFSPVKGRMQHHSAVVAGAALTVIDDSYNANPDSVAAAIAVLAQQGASNRSTVLVLGDMGEVGDQGEAFHTEAGQAAAAQGVGALYTLGALSQASHAAFKHSEHSERSGKVCQHFADGAALNAHLLSGVLPAGSTVLVKGSRFMRMEFTVDALLGRSDTRNQIATGVH